MEPCVTPGSVETAVAFYIFVSWWEDWLDSDNDTIMLKVVCASQNGCQECVAYECVCISLMESQQVGKEAAVSKRHQTNAVKKQKQKTPSHYNQEEFFSLKGGRAGLEQLKLTSHFTFRQKKIYDFIFPENNKNTF